MKKRFIRDALVIMTVFIIIIIQWNALKETDAAVIDNSSEAIIMSYNVLTTNTQPLTATNADGTRTRGEMLIDLIDEKQPDSMGLNEVTSTWEDFLESDVITNDYSGDTVYAIAGLLSDSNLELKSGSAEYSPILYRSDKYDLASQGGFWFSNTPNTASKYGDITDSYGNVLYSGMKYNRICSYAVLYYKNTSTVAYVHINVHFDHQSSDYINLKCSKQVKTKADELKALYNCPVVISGDFNALETTNAYHYLANGEQGYVDAKYVTDNHSMLFSCPGYGEDYSPTATGVIDHIMVSNENVGVYEHNIIPNEYLSDHSCVYVRLLLNEFPLLNQITIDDTPIESFNCSDLTPEADTNKNSVILGITADEDHKVYVNDLLIKSAGASLFTGNTAISLDDGDNNVALCVENADGCRTIYNFNIYKNYGEPIPIISEIYPNARIGYRYFEVTNAGTSYFNTADYNFLWGNIKDESTRTWDSKFPVSSSENVDVKPGDTVVFWFTYGGVFENNTPLVDDFNDEYETYLTDKDIIVSDPAVPFQGFLDGTVSKTYTMGANKNRGMRIAKAKDENGNEYSWSQVLEAGDACFLGPSITISSYHSISATDLTTNQLFKFKYNDEILTLTSDILDASSATPGKYDTRIGNEIRDAYSYINAREYDAHSLISETDGIVGNTKSNSWVFYNNIDFGSNGADAALFYGSVKGSNAAGSIQIYIDGESNGDLTNATYIGSCTTTATSAADWDTYALFSGGLNQSVTGIHNVTLKFVPTLTYVINLDYFGFTNYTECETVSAFTDGINIQGNVASANLQYTSSATGMSDNITNGYNLIGNTVNGSTAKYEGVDFYDGGITGIAFNMALRTSRCYGTIEIYLLNQDGSINRMIGECSLTENDATDSGAGNYKTYHEFYGEINDNTITGEQDILLKFVTPTYYVGNIDYFYLYK